MQIGQRELFHGEVFLDAGSPQALNPGVWNDIEFNTVLRDDLGFFDLAIPSHILVPLGIGSMKFNFGTELSFVGPAYSFQMRMVYSGAVIHAGTGLRNSNGSSVNPQGMAGTGLMLCDPGAWFTYQVMPTQDCFTSDFMWCSWFAFPA